MCVYVITEWPEIIKAAAGLETELKATASLETELKATASLPLCAHAIALTMDKNTNIFQRAGPERDAVLRLQAIVCVERGCHRRDEQLAWGASQGQGTFQCIFLGTNFYRANHAVSSSA